MPSPSRNVVLQPTVQNTTSWSVSSINRALNSHELGDFSESGKLARSFGRDDRIGPCITDRQNALVGADSADFELKPVEEGSPWARRSKAAVDPLKAWYYRVIASAWLRKTLYGSITIGASLSHVLWERSSRSWLPKKLTAWEPENFFWSEHDQLYIASTTTGWQPIEPGDPNWFLYTPGGDQSWMSGGVRPLGMPYIMRTWTPRDWSRYNERHGLPIVKIMEPAGEQDGAVKDGFYASVRQMGSKGVVRVPQGDEKHTSYDVDLIEATARSHDSFDKFLDKLNTAIAICLKGQNLSTEVKGGAYASTAWHMRVRKDFAETDAVTLSDAIREQLIKPWGRANVPSWNDEIAPWPTWNLDIPEDRQAMADSMKKGVETLVSAASNPLLNIDLTALADKLDIPLLKANPKQKVVKPEDVKDEPPTDDPDEDADPAEQDDDETKTAAE